MNNKKAVGARISIISLLNYIEELEEQLQQANNKLAQIYYDIWKRT